MTHQEHSAIFSPARAEAGARPRPHSSRLRRLRAHLNYLRAPTIKFAPTLILMVILVLLGGYLHQRHHPEVTSFGRGLYLTFCLIFMEHLLAWPDHWALEVYYVGMPVLGLVVFLEAFIRYGTYVLRRDETSRNWVEAMTKTMQGHVILCGLGKLGIRTLEQLLHMGEDVVILEIDNHCRNLAYAREEGVTVLLGSGREKGIFDSLNVVTAKSIILATDDDLFNLEMALDAQKSNPDIRVVMRMFDQELAAKIRQSFDIKLTFSTSELSAPLFATSASDESIINSFYVDGELMVISRLRVNMDSELAGTRVGQLEQNHPCFVLSMKHGDNAETYPDRDSVLHPGAEILLQSAPATLSALHGLNHDRA